jgi:hypothetical protein
MSTLPVPRIEESQHVRQEEATVLYSDMSGPFMENLLTHVYARCGTCTEPVVKHVPLYSTHTCIKNLAERWAELSGSTCASEGVN